MKKSKKSSKLINNIRVVVITPLTKEEASNKIKQISKTLTNGYKNVN